MNNRWVWQVLIAIDQFINAIFGGYADETLSSRAHRQQNKKWYWFVLRRFIDLIFFFEKDHCRNAWESENERAHLPHSFR